MQQEKLKLVVICRVEPGCLGPNGLEYIDKFCEFAQKIYTARENPIYIYEFTPRYDKSLPEMEYKIANRKLSSEKAEHFFSLLQTTTDEFEYGLHQNLVTLIEKFFNR